MTEVKPNPTIQSSPVNHKQPPVFWGDKKWIFLRSTIAFINIALWFGHARIGKGWAFVGKIGFVFATCIAFDSLADRWLDCARLSTLESRYQRRHRYDCQSRVITYPKLWEAHEQRKAHCLTKDDPLVSSRPWFGPNNFHHETCDCIRDIFLSVVLTSMYLWTDITVFKEWWIPLIWGKYMEDIFIHLLRQPFVGVPFLNFRFSHHLGAGVFLAGASIWSTQTIPSVHLCIALIWLSNMCTTVRFVYRSFCGIDYRAPWVLSFVIQRMLRWGGTVWAFYSSMRSGDDIMMLLFEPPYFHIWNIVCLLGIEILDISVQKKTLHRFRKKQKVKHECK